MAQGFAGGYTPLNRVVDGRLTLTSLTPVTTADVTGATTIYFTPYKGNSIALYTGTNWKMYQFSEISLALGTLTNALPYDVFIYDNAGTLTLEFTAWTNDTTRATALVLQNGVYVKTGATTRRYLGTFRTTSTTTTEDSYGGAHQAGGKRFLWNAYNRVQRHIGVIDTTDNWSYTTATFRQANGNAGNQVACVIGLSEDLVSAMARSGYANNSVTAAFSNGIGIDSVNTNSALVLGGAILATGYAIAPAEYKGYLSVGYHYIAWLEISQATGTTFWIGDTGVTYVQAGMLVTIMC